MSPPMEHIQVDFSFLFYLILPLCFPHNKSIVIRVANGGRVTNQSLINLNPGIQFDKRGESLRSSLVIWTWDAFIPL